MGETLDRLAVALLKLVAEAAVLAAGRWLVREGGLMDEDTAVEAVDSTADAVAALSPGEKERTAEDVFAAENQDAADTVVPT